jgi:flavodoxin
LKFIWHSSLRKKLLDKCFEIIGDFSCKGFDNFGPFKLIGGLNKGHPNQEDIKKAKEFARKVKQKAISK